MTIEDGAGVDDASLVAHINTRGIFRLNPLIVGAGCVLKSGTRLLSGAQMDPHSILKEHTLVLAGECVESGRVWQGWPSSKQSSLEMHREDVKQTLDDLLMRKLLQSLASSESIHSLLKKDVERGVTFKEKKEDDQQKLPPKATGRASGVAISSRIAALALDSSVESQPLLRSARNGSRGSFSSYSSLASLDSDGSPGPGRQVGVGPTGGVRGTPPPKRTGSFDRSHGIHQTAFVREL